MGAVVAVFFDFFAFVAFAFFVFSVFVVSCEPASCANTGMVSENTITNANKSVKSFFMLGLDLPMNFLRLSTEQGMGHFCGIALHIIKYLKYRKL